MGGRFMRMSAFSLAFGYVAFGIAALILFAAPLWYAWDVTIERSREEILRADTQRMTEVFQREGPQGLKAFIRERVSLQIAAERILLLTDASFHPLAGNLAAWPRGVPTSPGTYTLHINLDGAPAHVVLVRTSLPGGYNLLVGRDLAHFAPLKKYFWYGLSAAVLVLLIVGVVGGVMMRRALLARVESIRTTVQAIVLGDLGHRLPSSRGGDELDTLSRTINSMLDQIEQLVHGIRDVSNAIAHDLRTPLAELRSRLEELSLTKPAPEEAFAEIEGAVADVDRVIGIFNALLRLAEIDTGARRSGFVEVNATELTADAVEFYLPAAEEKGIEVTFRTVEATSVWGDPVLLAQAVGNLIDNALKYVGDHGAIAVQVRQRPGRMVEICVADNGPGIPDAEKDKVTERFYRGDASRGTPGVGLGLTLVEAVAKLHGGGLRLEDNRPGLRAVMLIEGTPTPARREAAAPLPAALRDDTPAWSSPART